MRGKKTIVLEKEITIETLLAEIHTETGITEGEGEAAATAGAGVGAGVKRGCETGIERGAGRGAEAGRGAGVGDHSFVIWLQFFTEGSFLCCLMCCLLWFLLFLRMPFLETASQCVAWLS